MRRNNMNSLFDSWDVILAFETSELEAAIKKQ
jgi:hypothetical protein